MTLRRLLCIVLPAIDLIERAAIGEVRLLGLLPAAKQTVDGEQFELWKIRTVFGCGGQPGTEIMPGYDFLALPTIQILQVRFGHRTRAVAFDYFVYPGDGWFRQNTGGRINDLEFVSAEFVDRHICFVFPRQQHVAESTL